MIFSFLVFLVAGMVVAQEKPVNYNANSQMVLTDPSLMETVYDCQTNITNQNRLYFYPDGTIGAVATMAHLEDFTDRGTGYNYFNGTAWGPQPAARIETVRTGWPSYAPYGPVGEAIVAHQYGSPLIISTRATKGTGTWTQMELGPPAGATGVLWPRMVTNGPDHMNIHIICLTTPIFNGGVIWNDMDGALIYNRSLDGGATWDGWEQLDGMTFTEYLGFSGDSYTWAEPSGNTLCFVVGDSWYDQFIMKSTDNGNTWTKTIIWDCPYDLWNGGTSVPTFWCPDGSSAIALDNSGTAHVTFGLMSASGQVSGDKFIEPFTDGLLYWNETMPSLPVNLNPNNLPAVNYIGWVQDTAVLNAPATELAGYKVSLSSFPTMAFDQDDNLYVIWSGVTMLKDPDNYMLRHLFARGKYAASATFEPQIVDITGDFAYNGLECVYPSASPFTTTDRIPLLFQADDAAGIYLLFGEQGQTLITQNAMIYIEPLMAGILPPVNRILQNISIPNGQSVCYDATQTITVAGNSTTFTVENGGSATMIAGQNIIILPYTKVYLDGYFHAYITTTGEYCSSINPTVYNPLLLENQALITDGTIAEDYTFKVYPNPTIGKFTLEFVGNNQPTSGNVEIYGMRGEKVLSKELEGVMTYQFSLSGYPVGLYFIHVINGDRAATIKIILQ